MSVPVRVGSLPLGASFRTLHTHRVGWYVGAVQDRPSRGVYVCWEDDEREDSLHPDVLVEWLPEPPRPVVREPHGYFSLRQFDLLGRE